MSEFKTRGLFYRLLTEIESHHMNNRRDKFNFIHSIIEEFFLENQTHQSKLHLLRSFFEKIRNEWNPKQPLRLFDNSYTSFNVDPTELSILMERLEYLLQ
jgi:hypothetical protein